MQKLILFIHGLGGSADGTWKKFPELIRKDAELSEQYDVDTIDYDSGAVGSKPGLPTCAADLKTWIETHHSARPDIALIAHSQGGLVARFYIAERIISAQPLRVSRLLTFATPHQGSGLATWLKWVPLTSQQTEDLDPNSEFMRALAVAWGQAKADGRVLTKYVVAAGDAFVGQVSAMGPWSPGYEVVSGVGHLAVVKPGTAGDTSVLIAKKFLLEEGLQPGGVEADYTAPLLRLNYVEAKETTRFIYAARVLPFIGRDAEIDKLSDFLGGLEQPFRWLVLYGSGGVGKSRLALELCLGLRNDWHAGFLPQEGNEPNWGRWQPLMPTLIVVDYAARDTERTGALLRALSGRGPADGTSRLPAPVRVLLIERTGKGDWLNKIVGTGTTKARVEAAHASEDLQLLALSDPWPIFEFVLGEAKKPLPAKKETLAALEKIDSERRPLFAYFMADAIGAGHDVRHFDAERLLDDVIDRARDKFWKPAGAMAGEERLLALATMTRGLPVRALESVTEKLLPAWDIDRHPAAFLAMTGRESGENIAPLEPDIVGEHFALSCLAQKNLSDAYRARFCGLAWGLGTHGMMQFMLRAHRDLPHHTMLPWVRKLPPAKGEQQLFWSMAALELMIDLRSCDPDAARELLRDMRGAAASVDEYWERLEVRWPKDLLWELWAGAAAVSIGGDLESLLQNSVLAGPTGIQTKSSAKKVFFYENLLVSRNPVAARTLLDDMRDVAKERDEASLWKTWAYAALALMEDLVSRDPVAAWTLLGDIVSVTVAKHGEDSTWEAMINNIVNAAVLTWLDKTREVAAERDEAALWEQWAKAALGLMEASSDPASLMDNMLETIKRHPGAAQGFVKCRWGWTSGKPA